VVFSTPIRLYYLLQDSNIREFLLQLLCVEYPPFHYMTKGLTVASDISQFSVMWHKLISGCKQVEKRITDVYQRSNYRQLQVMWDIQYSATDNCINVCNCGLLRSEITCKMNQIK